MAYGLNKRITLKDNLAICLLFLVDFIEYGSKSYHSSWISHPTKFVPFGRTQKYWEKLTKTKLSKTSTYYRLKREKVFSVKADKVQIDLNSSWWQEFLNYRFRFFKAPNKWNHKWIVIFYDIPEKNRFVRDNFRQVIENIGFKCWQRSVWLTINPVEKLVGELLEDWELDDFVTVFTAQNMFDKKDYTMIKKLFEPDKLERKYKNFINEANLALRTKNKKQIKSMIDNYPNLVFEDSGLPSEFFSEPKIRQKVASKFNQLIKAL